MPEPPAPSSRAVTPRTIWYLSKYASPQKYFFGTRHFYLGAAWAARGHTVCVVTSNASHMTDALPQFRGTRLVEDIDGVTAVWLNGVRSKTSGGATRVLGWFDFERRVLLGGTRGLPRPDVVIASSLSLLTAVSGALLARRHGARFVFEVRDIWPLSAVELGGYSPRNPFMRLLARVERFGYRRADTIVGTMPNLCEHVAAVVPEAAAKVVCVPQGVDAAFYADPAPLPAGYAEAHLPAGAFSVVYAGTLNANNPMDALLGAARRLADRPDIAFVLLGHGTEKARLQAAAADLPNVFFPPPVAKREVFGLLSRMDVAFDSFSSTLGRFGLSRNKWIDYMAAGKPILCAFDGFRSMIDEADAGSFVPFDDPEALADEILRYRALPAAEIEAMGARARRFVFETRSFAALAAQYEAHFDGPAARVPGRTADRATEVDLSPATNLTRGSRRTSPDP